MLGPHATRRITYVIMLPSCRTEQVLSCWVCWEQVDPLLCCICSEESNAPMPGTRMTWAHQRAELGLKGAWNDDRNRRPMDLHRAVLVRSPLSGLY